MLTVKTIEAASYGKSPCRLSDGHGLYLRLNKGGSKTFQHRTTVNGKTKWLTLGTYPEMKLSDARVQAALVKARQDSDPQLKTNDAHTDHNMPTDTSIPLLRDYARVWYERKIKTLSNGKHAAQNWSTLETYVFPALGNKRLDQITQREVVETFEDLWLTKNTTAKRTLGRLSEIYEVAKSKEIVDRNPAMFSRQAAFGKSRQQTKHHVALDWQLMPKFWIWLQEHDCPEDVRQMIMAMILTAKRTKEARFVGWDDLDFGLDIWTSKPEHMKMRREHRIPMSRQLRIVFENVAFLRDGGPPPKTGAVFSRPGNKSGVIDENRARLEIQKFSPSLTGHGLRSAFRTWARKKNAYELDVMEHALSHEKDPLVAAYFREDLLEERRPMMQDWADFVTSNIDPDLFSETITRMPKK